MARWPGGRWLRPVRVLRRTPRTRRGWLITIAIAGAALAAKLAVGASLVLLLLRHLPR
jgi:hypothetical protein